MPTIYVARDKDGKIVSVASAPTPGMDPPITEEVDSEDPQVKEYEATLVDRPPGALWNP